MPSAEALVRAYFERMNANDWADAAALFADDFQFVGHNPARSFRPVADGQVEATAITFFETNGQARLGGAIARRLKR